MALTVGTSGGEAQMPSIDLRGSQFPKGSLGYQLQQQQYNQNPMAYLGQRPQADGTLPQQSMDFATAVRRYYTTALGREPSQEALDFWVQRATQSNMTGTELYQAIEAGAIENGEQPLASIADVVSGKAPAQPTPIQQGAQYQTLPLEITPDQAQQRQQYERFVTDAYAKMLGREPNPEALAFWANKGRQEGLDAVTLIRQIEQGARDNGEQLLMTAQETLARPAPMPTAPDSQRETGMPRRPGAPSYTGEPLGHVPGTPIPGAPDSLQPGANLADYIVGYAPGTRPQGGPYQTLPLEVTPPPQRENPPARGSNGLLDRRTSFRNRASAILDRFNTAIQGRKPQFDQLRQTTPVVDSAPAANTASANSTGAASNYTPPEQSTQQPAASANQLTPTTSATTTTTAATTPSSSTNGLLRRPSSTDTGVATRLGQRFGRSR